MSKAYIKVNSVTHAIKVKNVLNANGVFAQVVRNTNVYQRTGCSYSVLINGEDSKAEEILRKNNVRYIGINRVHEPS